MISSRLRLTVLASAAAITLAACGSSSSKSSTTTAAAGAGTTAAATATTAASATTSGGGDAYGYGGGGAPTTAAPTASPATTAASGGGAAVALANAGDLGQVLVDAKGMTLYEFDKDSGGKSACSGGCATAWPPAVATGTPAAGAGVDGSKLSTITRDDGKTQLVYNGHPLYTFSGDAAAGQAGGQGSGGAWYAVNAAGDKIDKD